MSGPKAGKVASGWRLRTDRRLLRALRLALLSVFAAGCQSGGDSSPLQGVVLILLDTVRADHLGCYGYQRPTSPRIDALARDGVRFQQAVAPSPWTLPSAVGLLAGQYSERVYENGLTSSAVEALQAAGIVTAAFTEGGYMSKHFALDRGFDEWTEEEGAVQFLQPGQQRDPSKKGGIERTFARAEQWLAEHGNERFFLFVHTYEPHVPYTNRDFVRGLDSGRIGPVFTIGHVAQVEAQKLVLTPAETEYVKALYDGDIASSDRHVGRLLDKLDGLDLAERVAVIVASDHGEELGDHYPHNTGDHGHSLLDSLVMVPLIVRNPAGDYSTRVVEQQVRIIDVMPTVAEWMGVEIKSPADGRSLVPLMTGDETEERLALLGQTEYGPVRAGLRWLGHKYITSVPFEGKRVPVSPEPPPRQLYDLRADPGEFDNLVSERPRMAELLDRMLHDQHPGWDRFISPDLSNEADPEVVERLRSLGYLR